MSIILMSWPLKLLFMVKTYSRCLKLGRAQGAAIAAALSRSIPIFEYAPRKIKMSITGRGAASKEQVASMLMSILKFSKIEIKLDATDGLAAALCHFYQTNNPVQEKATTAGRILLIKIQKELKSNSVIILLKRQEQQH